MPDSDTTTAENEALERAISERWYRATRLCKEAWLSSRDYQDTARVRRLLARAGNQLTMIDRMSGHDPDVIDAEVIEPADSDVAAIPAAAIRALTA